MKFLSVAPLLGLASSVAISRRDDCPPAPSGCCAYHLAVPGDTCNSIAASSDIPLDQFYGQNPSIDRNNCPNLRAGCYYCTRMCGLLIPGQCPPLTRGCTESRPVVAGDTCWVLVGGDSSKLEHFFDLNPLVHRPSCDNLQVGCRYCVAIPPQDTCQGGHWSEPVRPGQICWELIGGVDQARLNRFYELNPGVARDCSNLQVGMRYCIPN